MTLQWDPKDPDEVLDFDIDWSTRLDTGDTIATSAWAVVGPDALLIIDSNSFSASGTKVWLSGGTLTPNGYYTLRNRVTTAGGRRMDQSVRLKIREK